MKPNIKNWTLSQLESYLESHGLKLYVDHKFCWVVYLTRNDSFYRSTGEDFMTALQNAIHESMKESKGINYA